jgi:hypothetical protein
MMLGTKKASSSPNIAKLFLLDFLLLFFSVFGGSTENCNYSTNIFRPNAHDKGTFLGAPVNPRMAQGKQQKILSI